MKNVIIYREPQPTMPHPQGNGVMVAMVVMVVMVGGEDRIKGFD